MNIKKYREKKQDLNTEFLVIPIYLLIGAYSLYSVIITCLILASKFYLETENVVVNADIGKFIKYRQAMIVAENKINDYPSDQEIMNYS